MASPAVCKNGRSRISSNRISRHDCQGGSLVGLDGLVDSLAATPGALQTKDGYNEPSDTDPRKPPSAPNRPKTLLSRLERSAFHGALLSLSGRGVVSCRRCLGKDSPQPS